MLLLLALQLLARHVLALLQLLDVCLQLEPRAGPRRRVPVCRLLRLLFRQRGAIVELRSVEAVRLLAAHGCLGWVCLASKKQKHKTRVKPIVFDATPRALTRKNILQQKRTEKGA
jgi:hypothetical protein